MNRCRGNIFLHLLRSGMQTLAQHQNRLTAKLLHHFSERRFHLSGVWSSLETEQTDSPRRPKLLKNVCSFLKFLLFCLCSVVRDLVVNHGAALPAITSVTSVDCSCRGLFRWGGKWPAGPRADRSHDRSFCSDTVDFPDSESTVPNRRGAGWRNRGEEVRWCCERLHGGLACGMGANRKEMPEWSRATKLSSVYQIMWVWTDLITELLMIVHENGV